MQHQHGSCPGGPDQKNGQSDVGGKDQTGERENDQIRDDPNDDVGIKYAFEWGPSDCFVWHSHGKISSVLEMGAQGVGLMMGASEMMIAPVSE